MQPHLNANMQARSPETAPLVLGIRSVHLGDQRQVEAVAHELSSMLDAEIEFISARLRRRLYSGPTRLALQLGLFNRRLLSRAILGWIWKKLFRGTQLPNGTPAIICSTLIPAEIPSAVLAQWSGAITVHLARPERLGRNWFSALVTPQGLESVASDIVLSQAPTALNESDIEQAGMTFVQERNLEAVQLWTLLIGGNGGSYDWQTEDYVRLAQQINECSEAFGIRWLISTSPRTGRHAESILRSLIAPQSLAASTWYSEAPANVIAAYMGAGQRTWVTEESISMLSDATLTGKPIYSLAPEQYDATSKQCTFAKKLERAGRSRRLAVGHPITAELLEAETRWHKPQDLSWRSEFREQMLIRLPESLQKICKQSADHRSQSSDLQIHFLRTRYSREARPLGLWLPQGDTVAAQKASGTD